MGRTRHFLSGLGQSAINAADRWWEKEKEKSKRSTMEDDIDSNNTADEVMGEYIDRYGL